MQATPHPDNESQALADLRKDYTRAALNEQDVDPDPTVQFQRWLQEALSAQLPEPNAMSLSTVNAQGRPESRIVLIKGMDARGFTFFTNYESRKGHALKAHPYGALLFHWVELERQVRIEGRVEKVSAQESDAYFQSRPLGSRLGAWASAQSAVIASRTLLDEGLKAAQDRFGDNPERPAYWGGYRLVPDRIEFWQGRPSRLHDRIEYFLKPDGAWVRQRLAP